MWGSVVLEGRRGFLELVFVMCSFHDIEDVQMSKCRRCCVYVCARNVPGFVS